MLHDYRIKELQSMRYHRTTNAA